jgi:hypothetical protein
MLFFSTVFIISPIHQNEKTALKRTVISITVKRIKRIKGLKGYKRM